MNRATFTQRWFLVTLISAAQLICLLIGESWMVRRLERELRSDRQQQALIQSRAVVAGVARYLEDLPPSIQSADDSEVVRAAYWVGTMQQPDMGTVYLIDNNGDIVSDSDAGTEKAPLERVERIALLDGRSFRVEELSNAGLFEAQGIMQTATGTNWAASHYVPRFGITVVTQRPDAIICQDVDKLIAAIDMAGTWTVLFITSMGFLMVMLIIQRYEHRLQRINDGLADTIERRGQELLNTRDAVVFGLAKLAESRDDDTGQHLERIRHYVRLLAEQMAPTHKLDGEVIDLMCITSSLHDIGKVGIPDQVLLKPGKLTAEEREIIQKHPLIGGDCLMAIRQRLGNDSFLDVACEIAFAHHERWDGGGYPFGLKGEQIPLAARIVALADVYDALTMQRAYKPALPHDTARKIIVEGRGTQFDPSVVDAFLAAENKFRLSTEHHNAMTDGSLDPSSLATPVTASV